MPLVQCGKFHQAKTENKESADCFPSDSMGHWKHHSIPGVKENEFPERVGPTLQGPWRHARISVHGGTKVENSVRERPDVR